MGRRISYRKLFLIALAAFCLSVQPACAQRDEDSGGEQYGLEGRSRGLMRSPESGDMIVTYPDGDMGVDLGGGLEVRPDGEMMAPYGYREEYRDSQYGATTQDGFVIFPDFEYPEAKGKKEAEKKLKEEYIIFREATTTTTEPTGKGLWGVSDPIEKGE